MILFRRLRFLLTKDRQRRELQEEMELHRDLRARQMSRDGVAGADEQASKLFGNETLLKEKANDMWGWNWLEDLGRDLRLTGRMLAGNRGFAAVAILTLALGIGANTAIFSVTNALLLKMLPVQDPQQLFRVLCDGQPDNASQTGDEQTSFSLHVYESLRSGNPVLSDLVAYVPLSIGKLSARTGAIPEEASAEMVSGNFFTGLGVRSFCGRTLLEDDASNHLANAVVSYGYATAHFGSPCAAVGQPLFVKGVPFTIVGVASYKFAGVEASPTDIWVPFQSRPDLNAWGTPGTNYAADPNWWCILMMARLKPGVSKRAAEAALNPPFQRAAYEPLGGKPQKGEHPTRLHLAEARGIVGSASFEKPLQICQTMVAILLLIACGNVSMLLAARNAARTREFSVRLAIGGSKSRLIRQLLTESLVLVCAGTILGLLFAYLATRVLASWAEIESGLTPDTTVLLFTLAVSIVAGLIFGVVPALGAGRIAIAESIKISGATAHRDHSKAWTSGITTSVQFALCLMLLVATGLLVQTLQNLKSVPLGFKTSGLLVFGVNPPSQISGEAQSIAFYQALAERLRSIPQVQSVTLTGNRVASGWSNNTTARVDGNMPTDVEQRMLRWNNVGGNFFTTLGIPILAGRDFTDQDSQNSNPVAVVNQTFVKNFFKGRNPLGHTTSFTKVKAFTIVGEVADSKYTGIQEDAQPMAWFPYTQVGFVGGMNFELRVSGPPESALPAIRAAMANYAPDVALIRPRTQQSEFEETISTQGLLAKLSTSFAILATILVMIGLYGTISYSVERRTSEVGVRVALGAKSGQVVWMILRSGLFLCAIGIAAGIPLAIASGRFLASLLFGVSPLDPVIILAAGGCILLVGALATYLPARRAAAIDPMIALRCE